MKTTTEEKILRVPLAELMPSPLNPRTTFDETKIAELAESVKSKGVLNPLLVRIATEEPLKYEIIAGERRFRAALLVQAETVPIIVREITDADALEMMLIENLQREELNAIEESHGIEAMLALRDADGKPMHTEASIALKIGKSQQHVENTQRLLLVPAKFHADLASGKIGRSLCYLAVAIPDKKLRERALGEFVKGYGQGPMTFRQARDHRARSYMTELRGAPFSQVDAELMPVTMEDGRRVRGGACVDCPLNTANSKEEDADGGQFNMCMNPACYQTKVEQHVKSAVVKAESEGKKVITGKAAEDIIAWDGDVASGSGKVRLNAKPAGEVLATTKKVPTWSKMVTGEVAVKIQVVIDKKGRVFEVADRNEAIEAAKMNGFKDLFSATTGKGLPKSDADKKEKERKVKERREQRIQSETTRRVMAAIVAAAEKRELTDLEWAALLDAAIGHAGSDGRKFVISRRECPTVFGKEAWSKDRMDDVATIEKFAKALLPAEVRGLVIELLLAQGVRWQDLNNASTQKLMKCYSIDAGEVEKAVKGEMAEGKKKGVKAGEPDKTKAPKAVEKPGLTPADRAMLAAKMKARWAKRKNGGAAVKESEVKI